MKENKKLYIGILLGILLMMPMSIYGVTTLFASEEVSYDTSTSKGSSTNVKGALDELYARLETRPSLTTTTTVSSDKLLSGITAYTNKGQLITGSMANNGSLTMTLSPGDSKTLSAGYYSGGTISTGSVSQKGSFLVQTYNGGNTTGEYTPTDTNISNAFLYITKVTPYWDAYVTLYGWDGSSWVTITKLVANVQKWQNSNGGYGYRSGMVYISIPQKFSKYKMELKTGSVHEAIAGCIFI